MTHRLATAAEFKAASLLLNREAHIELVIRGDAVNATRIYELAKEYAETARRLAKCAAGDAEERVEYGLRRVK